MLSYVKKDSKIFVQDTVCTRLVTELGVQRQSKKGRDGGGPSGDKGSRKKKVLFLVVRPLRPNHPPPPRLSGH